MEYRLDLDTLLLMLRQSTGSLYSEFQHISGVKGRCQVFLRLDRGAVKSCTIMDERGNEIVSGEVAIKLIQSQLLTWHYTEGQEVLAQPQEENPRSLIPRRTSPVASNDFMLWPRLYRSVYSLIDGNVSVEYIVRLLAREQGAERVREVLLYLQQVGLITFD